MSGSIRVEGRLVDFDGTAPGFLASLTNLRLALARNVVHVGSALERLGESHLNRVVAEQLQLRGIDAGLLGELEIYQVVQQQFQVSQELFHEGLVFAWILYFCLVGEGVLRKVRNEPVHLRGLPVQFAQTPDLALHRLEGLWVLYQLMAYLRGTSMPHQVTLQLLLALEGGRLESGTNTLASPLIVMRKVPVAWL